MDQATVRHYLQQLRSSVDPQAQIQTALLVSGLSRLTPQEFSAVQQLIASHVGGSTSKTKSMSDSMGKERIWVEERFHELCQAVENEDVALTIKTADVLIAGTKHTRWSSRSLAGLLDKPRQWLQPDTMHRLIAALPKLKGDSELEDKVFMLVSVYGDAGAAGWLEHYMPAFKKLRSRRAAITAMGQIGGLAAAQGLTRLLRNYLSGELEPVEDPANNLAGAKARDAEIERVLGALENIASAHAPECDEGVPMYVSPQAIVLWRKLVLEDVQSPVVQLLRELSAITERVAYVVVKNPALLENWQHVWGSVVTAAAPQLKALEAGKRG